jgi:hypothetical protein
VSDGRSMAADVVAFLDAHIDSIEALDVALLVRQYGWQRLTREFVARRTGRGVTQIAQVVRGLVQSGLLAWDPAVPQSFHLVGGATTLALLDRLDQLYADDPLRVVTYVARRSMERMRRRASRFAATMRREDEDD